MSLLAVLANNRFSEFLHHFVYSFPSPNMTTGYTDADSTTGQAKGAVDHASSLGNDGIITEPGEPMAFAGGVGPLSFAGSGYGVMLILMVSRFVTYGHKILKV